MTKEEAIPLVTIDPQTDKFIRNIEAPISIIGVAGMYRTGKSYLLNKVILDRDSGFGVGPTVNACTKGIWIWNKALTGQTEEGTITNILVIDSEGLGAVDQSANHDCRIFALVLLFSSMFLYNSVGTIDENAISNLSLVVNLTKHIHVKSQNEDSVRGEDYAKYFPSFLWILRDFSLQLKDSDEDPITASQYFELALKEQKGLSKEIEEKNNIRRMIQQFFPNRDCFTMVRPTTKEEHIQNLAAVPLNTLRPEFIKNVQNLRKMIFGNAQLKQLNGQPLDGEMIAGLMVSYIAAINDGAVPNIASAWTYICKDHCARLLQESCGFYDQRIQEKLQGNFPLSDEDLSLIHEEIFKAAFQKFKKEQLGENTEPYLEELESRVTMRYHEVRQKNTSEFKKLLVSGLETYYQSNIDPKIKGGQFKTLEEFQLELNKLRNYFMDLEPNGPNKRAIISDFLLQRLSDGAHIILSVHLAEHKLQSAVLSSSVEKAEQEREKMEQKLNQTKSEMEMELYELKKRRDELEQKFGILTESNKQMKEERKKFEDQFDQKLDQERDSSKEKFGLLEKKIQMIEAKNRQLEQDKMQQQSKFQTEQELVKQENEFLAKHNEELAKNLKEISESLASKDKKLNIDIVDIKKEYERKISSLEKELFIAQESIRDQQGRLEQNNQLNMSVRHELEEKNTSMVVILENNKNELKQYQKQVQSLIKAPEELQAVKSKLDQQISDLQTQLSTEQQNVREKEDIINKIKHNNEKEKAIQLQEMKFVKHENEDLQRQLGDLKRRLDGLSALESLPTKKLDFTLEFETERQKYESQIAELKEKWENDRKILLAQSDRLKEKLEDTEREKKRKEEDDAEKISTYKKLYEQSKQEFEQTQNQLAQLESERLILADSIGEKYQFKIEQLEQTIEDLKIQHQSELSAIQKKTTENIKSLKLLYEEEKKKLSDRLQDEKAKLQKLNIHNQDDLKDSLQQQQEIYEGQIEALQQQIDQLEIESKAYHHSYSQDKILREKEIEHLNDTLSNLKHELKETKERSSHEISSLRSSFTQEKNALAKRLEESNLTISQNNVKIMSLEQSLDSEIKNCERVKRELEKYLTEKQADYVAVKGQLENLAKEYKDESDKWLETHNEDSKNLALQKQKIEFLQKRINSLENGNDSKVKQLQDQLAAQEDQIRHEMNDQILKLTSQKELLEQRYENKKKQVKEAESQSQKVKTELEKEILIMKEKNSNLTTKISEIENQLEKEITSKRDALKSQTDNFQEEYGKLKADYETLRVESYEQELQLVECQATYEKDLALWEGERAHLKEAIKKKREELEENQKNFDIIVNKFKQFSIDQTEGQENLGSAQLTRIEQNYSQQLRELKDQHKVRQLELEERIKKLERENRRYNEKMLELESSKTGSISMLEERMRDVMQSEKALKEELKQAKRERDTRIERLQRKLEQEKELYRSRLSQNEVELKELNNRLSQVHFMHEEERAK